MLKVHILVSFSHCNTYAYPPSRHDILINTSAAPLLYKSTQKITNEGK
jgi:hypothetical protein